MRRHALKAIVTAAVAIAGLGTTAAPVANATGTICVGPETTGAAACFVSDGDYVEILDSSEDGHRAVAVWYTDYGRSDECVNTKGKGKWARCNYNLREKGYITIRAEVREGNKLIRKSDWKTYPIKGSCPSGHVCSD
ncbi:hypothetical protein [Streptomyces sp. MA5143a]|uniref:hypothetical protein n=1 Tax=Streptomyces sp. MA5143a TaxID=2083010 RepID=UPI000D1B9797|nr:hypothetical protein [Streptomyces sp. MA5143a]SPE99397.1 hypothetical protein SMA5143A_0104 [Streptomyces sp. MA5143a]